MKSQFSGFCQSSSARYKRFLKLYHARSKREPPVCNMDIYIYMTISNYIVINELAKHYIWSSYRSPTDNNGDGDGDGE